MRKRIIVCVMIIVGSLFAGYAGTNLYVMPRYNNVGVYAGTVRMLNENAAFRVNRDARLLVLEIKDDCYKVQDKEGRTGWIEKRLVALTKDVCSFEFDPKDVIGYIDIQSPVTVIDGTEPEDTKITLDRSFAENLKCNVDREALHRQVK